MVLVVTDDEALLTSRLQDAEQDSWGAGVVAIAGPRGYGTTRILSELRQAWLLGYGDVSIVSPVSRAECVGVHEALHTVCHIYRVIQNLACVHARFYGDELSVHTNPCALSASGLVISSATMLTKSTKCALPVCIS